MSGTATVEREEGQAPTVEIEGAGEVSGLVALAIREKVPVEVLERLVALQERVTERHARASFFEAVAAFQEGCPEIDKNRTAQIRTRSGGSYSYSFAPLETITRTIRPLLKEHGLAYSWTTEPGGGDVLNVVCILRHVEGHEERATFPVPTGTDAAMSAAQKNGAALTYGRRQSLVAVLGLVTADEDRDGVDGASGEKITDAQFKELSALRDEVKADTRKFCDFLGVDTLRDIPAERFQEAMAALEQKRGRR